ncbi:MAG: RelA/SpoT family protein [Bacteroidota bacterium]|nr:RelA/SpoT family protein [Bacteroidota bacterium]
MKETELKMISKEEEVDHLFDDFILFCEAHFKPDEIGLLRKAYAYAKQFIENDKWPWGESVLSHSISVARLATEEIGLFADSAICGILHNIFNNQKGLSVDPKEIEKLFGRTVLLILEGIRKINAIDTENIAVNSENYRKLMLALSGDARVILIKIADRLYDMRTLSWLDQSMQMKFATETSYLYAPLAHRLGLYKIKSELEDLSLRYLNTEIYSYIEKRLDETKVERSRFVAGFVKPIEEKLKAKGFDFEMKARTKSIYSIWNKMNKQKVSFDEVYDLFAIRVILNSKPENEKSDCWQVYSIVTEEYQPNPERLRDWISIPKINGYESLHTTVMGPHGRWVEIQIRTRRMDEIAEKGFAAHWKYKGGKGDSALEEWLSNIRGILENPDIKVADFIEDFQKNIYEDEIFVFTPKGELRKLPAGSTVLDFAYDLHSQLGDKCTGGKVNKKIVSIKHKLKNGDQIEIETSAHQKPKMDWLDFVVTAKAKNKIRSSLNEEKKREAANGKEIILRKFKNWKMEFNDDVIRLLFKHYKLKYAIDLYYQISVGKIDPLQIKDIVSGQSTESEKEKVNELLPKDQTQQLRFSKSDDFLVIDNNINNVVYKLARCCNPIPGDKIFGFVTIGEGIKIHRQTCPNAVQMRERYPYRIIKAVWRGTETSTSFLAAVRISGDDKLGLLGEISGILAREFQIQIRSVVVNTEQGMFDGTIRILVHDVGHLDYVIQRLRQIKGVRYAIRTDN